MTIALLVSPIAWTVTVLLGCLAGRWLEWMLFLARWAPHVLLVTVSGESCMLLLTSAPPSPLFAPRSYWHSVASLAVAPVVLQCCVPSGRLSVCFKANAALRSLLVICQMLHRDWVSLFVPSDHEQMDKIVAHSAAFFAMCIFLCVRRGHILASPSALWNSKSTLAVGGDDAAAPPAPTRAMLTPRP